MLNNKEYYLESNPTTTRRTRALPDSVPIKYRLKK